MVQTRRAAPRASRLLRVVLAAIVLVVLAGGTTTAEAQGPEEFVVRIAARLHTDGRIEFGIQRVDEQGAPRLLHLEHRRFFPAGVTHHRWLRGDASYLLQAPYYDSRVGDPSVPAGTHAPQVLVIARLNPANSKVEFALEYELDAGPPDGGDGLSDPIFANKRHFPSDVTHDRWLYSSEIRFTRVFVDDALDDALMEGEVTLSRNRPGRKG